MTDAKTLRSQAAAARSSAMNERLEPMRTPEGRPERPEVRADSILRAKPIQKDGKDWVQVEGYASIVERGYEMWDMFGPYTEIVDAKAFDATLSANPEVVFRFNHAGTPMASTRNGRLELWVDESGLGNRALLNPTRSDVEILLKALEDEDVREQSFMFSIVSGQWSPDYMEFRITELDLDRGDVGPVTYGANPYTTIAARAGEFLAAIPDLPLLAAREAYSRLAARADVTPAPTTTRATGPSVDLLRAQLLVDSDDEL